MSKKFPFIALALALTLSAMPTRTLAEDKEKEEANEQKVKFAQVPAAAQKTLTEEAKGAKIDEVDKETDDGKTVYEVDVLINNKNYEIKVAEDGTLISKKLDVEEGKGEKEEKDEKAEKK